MSMPNNLKALIVILVLAVPIFRLAKPIALLFSSEADFARRRNVWIALTVAGFVSPSFWLFAAAAVLITLWAGRKDTNPIALYVLLLHVIAPISIEIPVVGINRLFSFDMYRLLSFSVLLPAVLRLRKSRAAAERRGLTLMDVLLLLSGALQVLLFVRPDTTDAMELHDSLTNVLRRALLFYIDTYLVFFAVSRSSSSKSALKEVMAAFCLACIVMAPIAVFENLRHWILYAEMGSNWGGDLMLQYTDRGGALRATVSSGHSLALGYLLATAFGFWLYLRTQVAPKLVRVGVIILLWLGLLAAYSRGPWVGGAVNYFAFVALGPRAVPRMLRALLVSALLGALVLVSPLGDRIVSVVPFLGGQVDAYNVTYRERLAERALDMIQESPLFGDQEAYSKLGDLRQGFGVIDFVNAYAEVAVFYGLVGLFLFASFIIVAFIKSYAAARALQRSDPDLSMLGVSLCACIIGTLIMVSTSSFMFAYQKIFYVLGGLAAAYIAVAAAQMRSAPAAARQAATP
jgi:O-antigen ligase